MITRHEDYCYTCGDSVPKQIKTEVRSRPVSAWTNTVFIVSLGFTAYCFLAEQKLSLPVALGISAALLLIRIIAERLANRMSN